MLLKARKAKTACFLHQAVHRLSKTITFNTTIQWQMQLLRPQFYSTYCSILKFVFSTVQDCTSWKQTNGNVFQICMWKRLGHIYESDQLECFLKNHNIKIWLLLLVAFSDQFVFEQVQKQLCVVKFFNLWTCMILSILYCRQYVSPSILQQDKMPRNRITYTEKRMELRDDVRSGLKDRLSAQG